MNERKAIERRIRGLSTGNPEDISKAFPDLETKEFSVQPIGHNSWYC